jgi:uncharacterized protein YjbI with pentapeptide repeats
VNEQRCVRNPTWGAVTLATPVDPDDARHADLARRLDRHWRDTEYGDGGERLEAERLDFSGLILDGVRLAEGSVANCTFDGSSLRGADLYCLYMDHCSFRGADLRSGWFYKADANECDFRETLMADAYFGRFDPWECDFRGANLRGAHLRNFGWIDCDLRDTDMSGAWLDWTSFGGCLMAGADFTGATGTVVRLDGEFGRPVNIGSPEKPELLQGDEFLDWLRAAGARNVSWFVPPVPVPRAQ